MKKLMLTGMIVLMGTMAFAQSNTVSNFFDKYKDDRDAKFVSVRGSMFKFLEELTDEIEDEEAQTLGRLAKGINGVEILSISKYETNITSNDVKGLVSGLKKEKYEELMFVKEGRKTVRVYASSTNSKISNMLILADEKEELALINIDGSIDLKDVSTLINQSNKLND